MMKKMIDTVLVVLAVLTFSTATWAVTQDVYTVGNSLTDGMGLSHYPGAWDKRDMLQRFVASSGIHAIGLEYKCNTAGAPLDWLWNNVNHVELDTEGPWDVLTLQQYGTRPLYDLQYPGSHSYDWGTITNAKNFITQALTNSPNIQVYIYSHWPGISGYKRHEQYMNETNPETGENYTWEEADAAREQAMADFLAAGGFEGHWDTPYTDPYSGENYRTRDFFEQVMDILNTDRHTPGDPIENLTKDVLIIPVGDVLYEINQRMKANPTLFPRAASSGGGYYTNVSELHADVPHLRGGGGRFVGSATWYATLYGKSPEGLDYTIYNDPDPDSNQYYGYADPYYEEITNGFAEAVYDVVWDVVSTHPRAGVATADADTDGLPDWWELEYYGGPTNAIASATASNGINTVEETYVAGLDPTDPDDTFVLSSVFSSPSSDPVLQWDGVYGREYTVYWTSNLLTGFGAPLETNLPWTPGSFTDTNHPGDIQGFYKIEVEMK